MNCNPFTLGHQYLIESAASEVTHLYVFVLSEDLSTFSAQTRIELVRAGTAHLSNVTVVSSGPYMVSSATFPSYFLNEANDKVGIHTAVDATIFATRIAPFLGITQRFLGEEPYSPTTQAYNDTLEVVLKTYGIGVKIIKRKAVGGEVVSASKVRRFIGKGQLDKAFELVPETTKEFLLSQAAADVIERIKREAHLSKRV
jgi:[citrate (pro-3S)-lyase] ligase